MSYIRLGIINKGKKDIVDVHGSEMYMDIDKTVAKIPYMVQSSIFENREKQSLGNITDKNVDKFVQRLKSEHVKGAARHEYGERTPSCVLNTDDKTLSCVKNHWYSNFSETIPNDWKFKLETRKKLKEIMK